MKSFYLVLVIFLSLTSCKEAVVDKTSIEKAIVINDVEVHKDKLVLNQMEGKWYYNNEPFSGYSLKFHKKDIVVEKLGYYKGKREGIAKKWSENGVLRIESYYKQNRLVKTYKSWWENGQISSEANYENGLMNGVEKKWYPTGQLAKLRQIVDGKEDGLQKAWLQNGTLYVNYEAKNGRIFGMRKANSCYKIEDEVVIRN